MIKETEITPKRNSLRLFKGNVPRNGTLVHKIKTWAIYRTDESKDYFNFKLVSTIPKLKKANYWLAFDKGRNRFALNRDARTLNIHNSDLHKTILDFMLANYGTLDPYPPMA